MTRKNNVGRSFIAAVLSTLCAIVFLMVSGSASAQLAGKGAVSGIVQDPTGAAIPGATITATNTNNGVATSTTSTSTGDYSIPTLDAGMYTITVTASGFERLTQQNVQINALETQTLNPKMTVGGGTENVTVTTIPPQLETTNATLGATMDQEMYSALPIEMGAYGNADQRRATDFAFLMPGVQGNNVLDSGNPTTNTGIVNGSGSKGAVSNVYVDGVAFVRAGGNGDPRYVWTAISVDAVDQFQLQTSGYSAVYEGQGIQNYTIKQGGKQYHGSLYEFFRNTALDTWGFLAPAQTNPATGKLGIKPIENSNEFGINLSGPLVPFGKWKDKLFFFGNYGQFRYASATPTAMEIPTAAQQAGNFQGVLNSNTNAELTYVATTTAGGQTTSTGCTGSPNPCTPAIGVYDPSSQATCTANSTTGPCRYRYGFGYGGTAGPLGNPVIGPGGTAGVDVVPASELSTVAQNLQQYLPTGQSNALSNNYIAPNKTGLINWSTTDRIDYIIGPKDTFTAVMALGRQASSNPVGQTTAGRNVAAIPYNFGQTYAPKTAVGIVEETHTFTPHLVNQLKYGYARYNGPTFDADELPKYSATAMGLSGLPTGAATNAFPFETFAGTNAPTNFAGEGPSVTLAENYTLVDNVQWIKGNHNFTFGGQIAWLLYNVINATGGSTPLTLAYAVTETAGITPSTNAAPKYAAVTNTGLSYASFLVGQVDKASYTEYLQQEFGARFRPISPYVQDNWKINSKLTLDIGLRYDFYPSITEVHNAESFFSPTLANPVTGTNGALQFTGSGAGTCNCSTPVNNWKKNFGPRIGLAFQSDPKTVWRASYDLVFSHGDGVGGSASSLGTLGFSSAPAFSANGSLLSTAPLTGTNGVIPAGTAATGVASGPAYGTGYTTVAGYTGSPSSGENYYDSYYGGRAPEFETWTFGFQHQWTNTLSSTMTYVGSQGHFLPTDGSGSTGPRGYWNDQLNPSYLSLGTNLGATGTALTTYCTANPTVCPSYTSVFNTSQSLATLLKPFPFQSVTDSFGYVANANYHALQTSLNMRPFHGLSFMANYTWSRSIDDGGTFRTGYAIPAGTIAGEPNASWKADRIERSTSTTNQPQHIVVSGVYALPFGRSVLAHNAVERAIFGGFKLSEVFQAFSGSPMAVTGSSCQTNPAQGTCYANYNPNFSGNARINGKWGQGVTAAEIAGVAGTVDPVYIAPSAGTATAPTGPFISPSLIAASPFTPAYTFANGARTAPYGLYSPGNYDLDLALVRSFPLHFTEAASFDFRAEMYNVTNHTWFSPVSAAVGNSGFGEVTVNAYQIRKAVQLSARLNF